MAGGGGWLASGRPSPCEGAMIFGRLLPDEVWLAAQAARACGEIGKVAERGFCRRQRKDGEMADGGVSTDHDVGDGTIGLLNPAKTAIGTFIMRHADHDEC